MVSPPLLSPEATPPCRRCRSSLAYLLPLLIIALSPNAASGHGYLLTPRSRNIVGYEDGKDWFAPDDLTKSTTPYKDYCPQCLNRGGTCGTSPSSGSGGVNYNHPPNAEMGPMPLNIQASYTQGQEIEVEAVLTAHHWGHTALYACPIENHGDVPDQNCFWQYPLKFEQDLIYSVSQDPNYPERAYVPPPDWGIIGGNPPGFLLRHKYSLPPDLNGEIVILQWHYVTGNSCFDVGYRDYDFPWTMADLSDCPQPLPADGLGVPEQFWNCAEITINSDGSPPTIVPPTTAEPPAPQPEPEPEPAPAPSPMPLTPRVGDGTTANMCGLDWQDANSKCGTPCSSGNATVCPYGEYCYADVNIESCTPPPVPTTSPSSTPSSMPQQPTPTAPQPTPTTGDGSEFNYCGVDWFDADSKCATACPGGTDSECPSGEFCFADCTSCGGSTGPTNYNYCGIDWYDANTKCATACPGGMNSECPSGEFCFADCTDCGGTNPSPTPPSAPTPPTPTPPTAPTSYVTVEEDSRVVAFVGNWQACPTADQYQHYTHIMISFAVSYTWSSWKNNCDAACNIGSPVPICNNQNNQALVDTWRAQGKKVLVSFGGAGMGGSWSGDNNDCWEYCFGKEDHVISQLDTIVRTQRLDGVDIDYEYFYEDNEPFRQGGTGAQARYFLETVTTGLKSTLPAGQNMVTHAPMDADMVISSSYYNILKNNAAAIDFLMPQYYNGICRPINDGLSGTGAGSTSALSHYTTLVGDMFSGDPTKVVFGFCITGCLGSGTGPQAASVMSDLAAEYPCNGGAFFWVAFDDSSGGWSSEVSAVTQPMVGCSLAPTSPTAPTAPEPTPTAPEPTPTAPEPTPTAPEPAPTPPADLTASSEPRCGTSEHDARERCGNACTSNVDCEPGLYCYGVHPNYCGDPNFQAPNYDETAILSSVYYRCGTSEVDARSFCKQPCTFSSDCESGEDCFYVNLNYCGSPTSGVQPSDAPTPAPVPAPVLPTNGPPVQPQDLQMSSDPRCGKSEVDARSRCGNVCTTNADCATGLYCFGVHPNYCGDPNYEAPNYDETASLSTVYYRCGASEIEARSFCQQSCIFAHDCNAAAGEICWAVHGNYCGSSTYE